MEWMEWDKLGQEEELFLLYLVNFYVNLVIIFRNLIY